MVSNNMLWQVKESTYQWAVGVLIAAVLGLSGATLGAYFERQEVKSVVEEVAGVRTALQEHEGLNAHPVSESRWEEVLRFMESIDGRLERLEVQP